MKKAKSNSDGMDLIRYLSDNFKCQTYKRDYEYERHLILRSKVELFLLSTLTGGRLKEWLPGRKENKLYLIRNGETALNLDYITENPYLLFRSKYCSMDIMKELKTLFPQSKDEPEFKDALHFFVRLFSFANPQQKWHLFPDDNDNPFGLEDAVSPFEKIDQRSTNHLSYHFKIIDNITEELSLSNTEWSQSKVNMIFEKEKDEEFIPFFVDNNVLAYSVMKKKINGKILFLPITFYVKTGDPSEVLLYILPDNQYPLYNTNKIIRHDKGKIFLTDMPELAVANKTSADIVWSSYYGSDPVIGKTDFSCLYGRDVYWLFLDKCPEEDPKQKYRTALNVYSELVEHNVNFNIVNLKNHSWGTGKLNDDGSVNGKYDDISIMGIKDFLNEAESKVYVPDHLREKDYDLISGDVLEKMEDEPYLIEPILRKGFYMCLFAQTGVGKSWVALSIALGYVHGKNIFQSKWITKVEPGKQKVIYFSGEMRDGEIGVRLRKLHKAYAVNDRIKKNFILKLGTYHDLVMEDVQEEFNKAIEYATYHKGEPGLKVSLIVIDNLATMTTGGEYGSNWDKLYRWICNLRERGISTIVIHHTNRKGKIRGTSKILDKADMIIQAIEADNNDNLGLRLQASKVRSEKKSKLEEFKAEIDLSAEKPSWKTFTMRKDETADINRMLSSKDFKYLNTTTVATPKHQTKRLRKTVRNAKPWNRMTHTERKKVIEDAWKAGHSNTQIAHNYNTSLSTISKFRSKNNLNCSILEKKYKTKTKK